VPPPYLAREAVSNRVARRAGASTKQRRILRLRQVKERTGLSKSTIYEAIAEGKFPAAVALLAGGKASGWFEDAVDAHLDARLADPTPRLPTNAKRAKAKVVAQ
jgi:prophage regulatory protein